MERTTYQHLLSKHTGMENKAREIRNTLKVCYAGKLDGILSALQVTHIEVALRHREDAINVEIKELQPDLDNAKAAYDFAIELGEYDE